MIFLAESRRIRGKLLDLCEGAFTLLNGTHMNILLTVFIIQLVLCGAFFAMTYYMVSNGERLKKGVEAALKSRPAHSKGN